MALSILVINQAGVERAKVHLQAQRGESCDGLVGSKRDVHVLGAETKASDTKGRMHACSSVASWVIQDTGDSDDSIHATDADDSASPSTGHVGGLSFSWSGLSAAVHGVLKQQAARRSDDALMKVQPGIMNSTTLSHNDSKGMKRVGETQKDQLQIQTAGLYICVHICSQRHIPPRLHSL